MKISDWRRSSTQNSSTILRADSVKHKSEIPVIRPSGSQQFVGLADLSGPIRPTSRRLPAARLPWARRNCYSTRALTPRRLDSSCWSGGRVLPDHVLEAIAKYSCVVHCPALGSGAVANSPLCRLNFSARYGSSEFPVCNRCYFRYSTSLLGSHLNCEPKRSPSEVRG